MGALISELTEKKKKQRLFWSVFFSYSMQQQTIFGSDCDVWKKVDFIWQPVITSSVVGSRRNSKAKLAPKKVLVTFLFGDLLPVWLATAFWILAKSLHLRSMLSKLMRYTKNYNTCSWPQSKERAQYFLTMPDHTSHRSGFKSERIGLWNFATSILTWTLDKWLPVLQTSW